MATTFERFRDILTTKFHVPDDRIAPEAMLDTLGLDSLDMIEVLFEVEDVFEVQVPQDGANALKMATVQDIVDTIDRAKVAVASEPEEK
ncbi:MAG: phosphopantetheine-binding protein [Acidobacteriota bacterium]